MTSRPTLDDALAGTFPASDPPAMTSPVIATQPVDVDDTAGATFSQLHVYRVVPEADADGAFEAQAEPRGGRWTSPGVPVLNAALSPTGALLEALAHLEGATPEDWVLVTARIHNAAMRTLETPPSEWRERPYRDDVRRHGDAWQRAGDTLLLKVPSALVPKAWNLLLNTGHADMQRVQVIDCMPLHVDARLRT